MLLTVEHLSAANGRIRDRRGEANGALYLPLDGVSARRLADSDGSGQPFRLRLVVVLMVVAGEEGDGYAYAIQFFNRVPGMQSGYETFDSFEDLIAYLAGKNLPAGWRGQDVWYAGRRGW